MAADSKGWTFLYNCRKWHYFKADSNQSLCGNYMLMRKPDDMEDFGDNSTSNCAACRRILLKDGRS